MKNLKFKHISAYNFLCFGPEGIEINFEDHSNVIFIQGLNKDAKSNNEDASLSEENKISSNGSGKSSIQEIIVYGLFGKTVKKHTALKKDGVIHNLVGKNCKVVIIWDDFKIVRTRSKNTLRLWESEEHKWDDTTEITTGSMDETQVLIEDKLGLNYETFLSICVFSDDQSNSFLESETPVKRQIIENLLSLGVYRKWQEKANEGYKNKKSNIASSTKEYELMDSHKKSLEAKQEQLKFKSTSWQNSIKSEIQKLKTDLVLCEKELENSDYSELIDIYNTAQNRIKELNDLIEENKISFKKLADKKEFIDDKKIKITNEIEAIKPLIAEIKLICRDLKNKITDIQSHIDSLASKKDHKVCNYCHGEIDPNNIDFVIKEETNVIEKLKLQIKEKLNELVPLEQQQQEKTENFNKVISIELEFKTKLNELKTKIENDTKELLEKSKIKEPQAESKTIELQTKIKQIKESINQKILDVANNDPYTEMIKIGKEEIDDCLVKNDSKIKEIKSIEEEIPYYQFWSQGFGDKGIRKIIVDEIIPQLNNRIAFWLQYLNDNVIDLKFDSEFNEIIERNPPDGTPYIYYAMSAGQRRRLNLAVSLAFADVMSVTAGCSPSLMFLDEVTTNIDPLGVQGIHNIIHALSEEKQVFITSHDQDLIKMLEGSDVIQLIHQNGFTKIKKD